MSCAGFAARWKYSLKKRISTLQTASLSKDPLKKTARRHESSELSADALPQTGSLFGELEDSMGLEPVFEPAPIQNAASDRAARLFGEKPADTPQWFDDADRPEAVQLPDLDARPDVDPFGEMLLAEASVKGNRVRSQAKEMKREKVPGRMTQSRGRSVKACTKADGPQIIRDPADVPSFTRIREDGTLLEIDPSTCTDPAMFAEMQAARSAGKPKKAKKSLMARAVDSLSRVEQPRRELERRLIKGLEDSETKEDVKAVLDRLEEMKLLSDQRFAEMKVRSAAPRMGDRKLQAELRRSGVDEATVRAAMEQLDEPEELRCWRVWCRKWSELPKDWKTREKMIRYLSYRGFGMGAIQKVLRGEVELPEENADGEF